MTLDEDALKKEPPWITRQKEAQKLIETITRLRRIHVYTSDEIVKIVGERYRKVKKRKPGPYGYRDLELRRLEVVFSTVYSRLLSISKLPRLSDMSPFHRALVENFIGEQYDESLKKVKRSLRLIKEFWNEYKLLLLSASDPREISKARREGSGRILSVVRRLKRDLELLRRARLELLHTHIISEGLPVVVVAGIPSSGKSTLVRALSTAEPEIAPYPFTTKNILVGKVRYKNISFYMVDTPGILERPPYRQNEIERKALAALATLPDIVLYLFDPSEERVQDLDEQLNLLDNILKNIIQRRGAGLLIAINKIDAISNHSVIRELEDKINDLVNPGSICSSTIVKISALKKKGLENLMNELYICLKKITPWLFA